MQHLKKLSSSCLATIAIVVITSHSARSMDPVHESKCFACLRNVSTSLGIDVTKRCEDYYCGPYQLTYTYWSEAGKPGNNQGIRDFEKCARDKTCAEQAMRAYFKKYKRDCNNDGIIDCLDLAALHKAGPTSCSSDWFYKSRFWQAFNKTSCIVNRDEMNLGVDMSASPPNPEVYEMKNQTLTPECLDCICDAISGCSPSTKNCGGGSICGPFSISQSYWKDGKKPGASWTACARTKECSIVTVKNYMDRYKRDCNDDGFITCEDYAAIHRRGPRACSDKNLLKDQYWTKFLTCRANQKPSKDVNLVTVVENNEENTLIQNLSRSDSNTPSGILTTIPSPSTSSTQQAPEIAVHSSGSTIEDILLSSIANHPTSISFITGSTTESSQRQTISTSLSPPLEQTSAKRTALPQIPNYELTSKVIDVRDNSRTRTPGQSEFSHDSGLTASTPSFKLNESNQQSNIIQDFVETDTVRQDNHQKFKETSPDRTKNKERNDSQYNSVISPNHESTYTTKTLDDNIPLVVYPKIPSSSISWLITSNIQTTMSTTTTTTTTTTPAPTSTTTTTGRPVTTKITEAPREPPIRERPFIDDDDDKRPNPTFIRPSPQDFDRRFRPLAPSTISTNQQPLNQHGPLNSQAADEQEYSLPELAFSTRGDHSEKPSSLEKTVTSIMSNLDFTRAYPTSSSPMQDYVPEEKRGQDIRSNEFDKANERPPIDDQTATHHADRHTSESPMRGPNPQEIPSTNIQNEDSFNNFPVSQPEFNETLAPVLDVTQPTETSKSPEDVPTQSVTFNPFESLDSSYNDSLTTASRIPNDCLECICDASSNCDTTVQCISKQREKNRCGLYMISWNQYRESDISLTSMAIISSGMNDEAAEEKMYYDCTMDRACAERLIHLYIEKHQKDCNNDGKFDCYDIAALHRVGPNNCNSSKFLNSQYWKDFNICYTSDRLLATTNPPSLSS